MNGVRSRAAAWGIRLVALGFLYAAHVALLPYLADDAYIHFRIADHLAVSGAPYFNLGQPAMGSSSPLWTLLLALVAALGWSLPHAVALFNAAATVACADLGLYLARIALGSDQAWSRGHAVLTTLIVAAPLLATSFQGMETSLALCLWLLGLVLLQARHPLGLAVLLCSAGLRLELGVTLVPSIAYLVGSTSPPMVSGAGATFVRDTRITALAFFGLVTAGLTGYLLHFFGTVVPDTVVAKSVVYQLSGGDFLRLLEREALVSSLQEFPLVPEILGALVLLSLLVTARALVLRWAHPLSPVLAMMVGTGAVVLLAYAFRRVFLFPWYIPLFTLPLLLGVWLTALVARSSILQLAAIVLLLPSILLTGRNLRGAADDPSWYSDFVRSARARRYLEIGRVLQGKCRQCSVVAAEIGGLGETFHGPITDGVGLVSPEVLEFHPLPAPEERVTSDVGAIPSRLIAQRQPDVVVGIELFVEGVLRHPIASAYDQLLVDIYLPEDRARAEDFVLWEARGTFILLHRRLPADLRRELASSLDARLVSEVDPAS